MLERAVVRHVGALGTDDVLEAFDDLVAKAPEVWVEHEQTLRQVVLRFDLKTLEVAHEAQERATHTS